MHKYKCSACGETQIKWSGKCGSCGAFGSISEVQSSRKISSGRALKLSTISSEAKINARIETGITEFDKAIGGGFVLGSVILLGGGPGIGKSTLLIQTTARLQQKGINCLYVSGEESLEQVQLRSARLQAQNSDVLFLSSTCIEDIVATVLHHKGIQFLVIDSIQTMQSEEVQSFPGSVSQVRECTMRLIAFAKEHNIVLLIVGHITKDGQIAGPKLLEHMVDTVLYFEGEGQYRIIRAVKNRFGAANEIGVFEMSNLGLLEVSDPSFIQHYNHNVSGNSIFPAIEGTRPILIEIQALTSSSYMASPRRAAIGWDTNRLAMLVAVLNVRYGISLLDKEIHLNVTGGIQISDPSADLAIAASLISALINVPTPQDYVFCGEIGLSGEIRQVQKLNVRLQEAARIGFKTAVIPEKSGQLDTCLDIIKIDHIEKLKHIFSS